MATQKYQVIIEKDEDGLYIAEVPGICACYAQGRSVDEALANVKDVLSMCIEEMACRGEEICRQNEIIGIESVEVEI
ncbi:MAG: type II toxin-antitoxin system HicB family antitoxin [bacterium]